MGRATRLGQAVARSAAGMNNLVGNNSQVSLLSPFYAVISNPKEVNGPLNFPPIGIISHEFISRSSALVYAFHR